MDPDSGSEEDGWQNGTKVLQIPEKIAKKHFESSIPGLSATLRDKLTDYPTRYEGNELFQVQPAVVHFSGFEVDEDVDPLKKKVYSKTITLVNVTALPQRCSIYPPETKYFSVKYNKKGAISAGLAEKVKIYFHPTDGYRVYSDSVAVMTRDGPFVVPIHAYPALKPLDLPDRSAQTGRFIPTRLDFGRVQIGESKVLGWDLVSATGAEFEYGVSFEVPHPDYTIISAKRGIVRAYSRTRIEIEYGPTVLSTAQAEISLNVAQYNFIPQNCVLAGAGAPLEKVDNYKARESNASMAKQEQLAAEIATLARRALETKEREFQLRKDGALYEADREKMKMDKDVTRLVALQMTELQLDQSVMRGKGTKLQTQSKVPVLAQKDPALAYEAMSKTLSKGLDVSMFSSDKLAEEQVTTLLERGRARARQAIREQDMVSADLSEKEELVKAKAVSEGDDIFTASQKATLGFSELDCKSFVRGASSSALSSSAAESERKFRDRLFMAIVNQARQTKIDKEIKGAVGTGAAVPTEEEIDALKQARERSRVMLVNRSRKQALFRQGHDLAGTVDINCVATPQPDPRPHRTANTNPVGGSLVSKLREEEFLHQKLAAAEQAKKDEVQKEAAAAAAAAAAEETTKAAGGKGKAVSTKGAKKEAKLAGAKGKKAKEEAKGEDAEEEEEAGETEEELAPMPYFPQFKVTPAQEWVLRREALDRFRRLIHLLVYRNRAANRFRAVVKAIPMHRKRLKRITQDKDLPALARAIDRIEREEAQGDEVVRDESLIAELKAQEALDKQKREARLARDKEEDEAAGGGGSISEISATEIEERKSGGLAGGRGENVHEFDSELAVDKKFFEPGKYRIDESCFNPDRSLQETIDSSVRVLKESLDTDRIVARRLLPFKASIDSSMLIEKLEKQEAALEAVKTAAAAAAAAAAEATAGQDSGAVAAGKPEKGKAGTKAVPKLDVSKNGRAAAAAAAGRKALGEEEQEAAGAAAGGVSAAKSAALAEAQLREANVETGRLEQRNVWTDLDHEVAVEYKVLGYEDRISQGPAPEYYPPDLGWVPLKGAEEEDPLEDVAPVGLDPERATYVPKFEVAAQNLSLPPFRMQEGIPAQVLRQSRSIVPPPTLTPASVFDPRRYADPVIFAHKMHTIALERDPNAKHENKNAMFNRMFARGPTGKIGGHRSTLTRKERLMVEATSKMARTGHKITFAPPSQPVVTPEKIAEIEAARLRLGENSLQAPQETVEAVGLFLRKGRATDVHDVIPLESDEDHLFKGMTTKVNKPKLPPAVTGTETLGKTGKGVTFASDNIPGTATYSATLSTKKAGTATIGKRRAKKPVLDTSETVGNQAGDAIFDRAVSEVGIQAPSFADVTTEFQIDVHDDMGKVAPIQKDTRKARTLTDDLDATQIGVLRWLLDRNDDFRRYNDLVNHPLRKYHIPDLQALLAEAAQLKAAEEADKKPAEAAAPAKSGKGKAKR